MKITWKSVLRNFVYAAKLTGIAILLAIILRVFFVASFKVPSYSMSPALQPGDFILVSKMILGPRVYKSLDFQAGKPVETKRLWGLREVRRNDILVFNFPYFHDWVNMGFNLNTFYVKRCVALLGDTFYIERGIYKVKGCDDTLGCYAHQAANYQRYREDPSRKEDECFPYDSSYGWTVLDFGPMYIPRKGDKIEINPRSIKLYRYLITYETGKSTRVEGDSVWLGDQLLENYTFTKNYYFMSGDYVFDSIDSRYWGLLPEEHIVGKAAIIWQSKDQHTGKQRWDRFLKIIR
jgi:signal peptidase I